MKTSTVLLALTIGLGILSAGCVRRTVTEEPTFTNPKTKNQYGGNHTRHIETKTIWFWQDGFRNP